MGNKYQLRGQGILEIPGAASAAPSSLEICFWTSEQRGELVRAKPLVASRESRVQKSPPALLLFGFQSPIIEFGWLWLRRVAMKRKSYVAQRFRRLLSAWCWVLLCCLYLAVPAEAGTLEIPA